MICLRIMLVAAHCCLHHQLQKQRLPTSPNLLKATVLLLSCAKIFIRYRSRTYELEDCCLFLNFIFLQRSVSQVRYGWIRGTCRVACLFHSLTFFFLSAWLVLAGGRSRRILSSTLLVFTKLPLSPLTFVKSILVYSPTFYKWDLQVFSPIGCGINDKHIYDS